MTALTESPAEVIKIDPESLEIANCYLQVNDAMKVANILGISTDLVTSTLKKREVRAYVDAVFKDMGFNNRFKMRELMDSIIKKKLTDMADADVGSNKDILEIMALSHKMSMDILDKEIALEKIRAENASVGKNQVNVQINNESNYGTLLQKLLGDATGEPITVITNGTE